MAATTTEVKTGEVGKSRLQRKRLAREVETVEATKIQSLWKRPKEEEEEVVVGVKGGAKTQVQMVSEVGTDGEWKRQRLEKHLKFLERRVKKDRAKILRLVRAMGQIGIIKGANTQEQAEAKSREGSAVSEVGPKEDKLAGRKKRRCKFSQETISFLANHQPERYEGISDYDLSMMSEASQALEMKIRAVCDRIYQEDIDIQQQCRLKGYVEM